MENTLQSALVAYAAPTLAGMKAASLFRYETEDLWSFLGEMEQLRREFSQKGVCLTLLKQCPHTRAVLVYVYRPRRLSAILENPRISRFLQSEGYNPQWETEQVLHHLYTRICMQNFPHEIGIFLDYPLDDVIGFIENQGKNYRLLGYWKVYGDVTEAAQKFARFKKCTTIYKQRLSEGFPLQKLTVRG